jgi:hypothetical protein
MSAPTLSFYPCLPSDGVVGNSKSSFVNWPTIIHNHSDHQPHDRLLGEHTILTANSPVGPGGCRCPRRTLVQSLKRYEGCGRTSSPIAFAATSLGEAQGCSNPARHRWDVYPPLLDGRAAAPGVPLNILPSRPSTEGHSGFRSPRSSPPSTSSGPAPVPRRGPAARGIAPWKNYIHMQIFSFAPPERKLLPTPGGRRREVLPCSRPMRPPPPSLPQSSRSGAPSTRAQIRFEGESSPPNNFALISNVVCTGTVTSKKRSSPPLSPNYSRAFPSFPRRASRPFVGWRGRVRDRCANPRAAFPLTLDF